MFKVGDMAVYPAHGVGVIERTESREISGCSENFFVIRIIENNMTIMVPYSNTSSVGLRQVIDESEVPKIFSILNKNDRSVDDNQTWNRRYRDYMDKIKSGSVFEIAEVFRDLSTIKEEKELSFGERKMLDTARNFLVKEISIAKDMDEKDVEKDIQSNLFIRVVNTQ